MLFRSGGLGRRMVAAAAAAGGEVLLDGGQHLDALKPGLGHPPRRRAIAGDDLVDQADEDGIVIGNLVIGASVGVTVTANVLTAAVLNGWIDFNGDGDWDDADEQVFVDEPISDGVNNLNIAVPSGATPGTTFARFRLTETGGYSYFGLAPNGEVEDYQFNVTTSSMPASAPRPAPRPSPPTHRLGFGRPVGARAGATAAPPRDGLTGP